MSSADERSFVGAIVKEAHTVFVNGPQWPSPAAFASLLNQRGPAGRCCWARDSK
jgi:hypothetical protein